MKRRILILVTVVIMTFCLVGCEDKTRAMAEVTTKGGQSFAFATYGGKAGEDTAMEEQKIIYLKDEEDVAYIHFFCEDCYCDEEYEVTAPFSLVLSCKCLDDPLINLGGYSKEYLVIKGVIEDSESVADATE